MPFAVSRVDVKTCVCVFEVRTVILKICIVLVSTAWNPSTHSLYNQLMNTEISGHF